MRTNNKKNSAEDIGGLSDMELAALSQKYPQRSDYAEELIGRYTPLIRARAAEFACDKVSRDDLESEAYLAAFRAVRSFDADKCRSFSSYIAVCVTNRIISVLRSADKHIQPVAEEYLDVTDSLTPETIIMERELDAEMAQLLSEKEYSIFRLYLEGASYGSIAQTLGIPEKSVDNAVQRVRRKLKRLYGE
ncbi:MAG: sigma-70 family RNA polymerase sigma factor [Oscillospiraceae bacterium]|nr:sigma-70 family RNA polymerase sigma factor [Oscillospiraceae bacterium]